MLTNNIIKNVKYKTEKRTKYSAKETVFCGACKSNYYLQFQIKLKSFSCFSRDSVALSRTGQIWKAARYKWLIISRDKFKDGHRTFNRSRPRGRIWYQISSVYSFFIVAPTCCSNFTLFTLRRVSLLSNSWKRLIRLHETYRVRSRAKFAK